MDDHQLSLVLTCVQLGGFVLLMVPTVRKICILPPTAHSFVRAFYTVVLAYLLAELAIQLYQLVYEVKYTQINILTQISMLIWAMMLETAIMLMLAYFWKQTESQLQSESDIFTRSSIRCKFLPLVGWGVIYLGIFIYFIVEGFTIALLPWIIYVCQGVAVVLFCWGIIVQTVNGLIVFRMFKRYEYLIHINLRKTKFLMIFWMTSVFNSARIMFLVIITFFFFSQLQSSHTQSWVSLYIYTFTAVIPILFYLLGFQVDEPSHYEEQTFVRVRNSSSKSSRHETELSESV